MVISMSKPMFAKAHIYGSLVCLLMAAAETAMQRFTKIGTIDLRVDFLRPGLGRHFMARAEITRLGGRVGSTQMRLHNEDGLLIATAAAAYIVS